MSQPDPTSPNSGGNWRDLRRQERHARREARRQGNVNFFGPAVGGLVLLVLGVGLLLQNMGYTLPDHWWALLLLLPALASLNAAMRSYRASGMVGETVGELIGAAIFTLLALALFYGINWGVFWPAVLIVIGAAILIRGYWPRG